MIYFNNKLFISPSVAKTDLLKQKPQIDTDITVVILAGSRDFGRCQLASKYPPALWPVFDKPVICRLLDNLASQGIRKAVICCNGNKSYLQQISQTVDSIKLTFSDEHFPSGTAGCIRDAAKFSSDNMFLVLSAQTIIPPNIQEVICCHKTKQSDLTVFFCHDSDYGLEVNAKAQFYICNRNVIPHIPQEGYFDIKESLIPSLFRDGKKVIAAKLDSPTLSFRNHEEYLAAIWWYLDNGGTKHSAFKHWGSKLSHNVIIAPDAIVDSTSRIVGPVIIMKESVISEKSVILGPAVIGQKVHIGKNSLIDKSVLWNGSSIAKDCIITNCVADYNVSIPPATVEINKAIVLASKDLTENSELNFKSAAY